MDSLVCENSAFINGEDEFDGLEVLEMDGDLLMSLLEESQTDERDEDQLNSLIRSLEAEIKVDTMEGQDLVSNIIGEECSGQSWKVGQMDGRDCSVSHDFDEFGWVDMDVVPSSLGEDMNWYMNPYGGEMDGIIEFIGNEDEHYSKIYHESDLGEYGYSSLWQETNSSELII
ncbi:putative Heat stress transcription factor B-4b [Quillaja saponaria]|uniref:Heat stress transcription factor B-4b n=1 Tax=Quillaja saponaria TaxID=32244 RepID=A0AAD7L1J7_QUISA|nr:putative Heat stress transcription factor B-4b [Quillaja saponaria]